MIDKVIIFGIKRGNKYISQNELLQSIGRSGRSYTKSGQAIVLTDSNEFEKAEQMLYGEVQPIMSVMDDIQNVSFHVLPMILNQTVRNKQSFELWFQKTLAYIQGKKIQYNEVVQYLIQNDMLMFYNDNIAVSALGQISCKYYFTPQRIKVLKERLSQIICDDNLLDICSISWMLSNDKLILGQIDAQQIGNYKRSCLNKGYVFSNGELLHGYAYYCLLNQKRPKWLKYICQNEYNDFQRLINALKKISQIIGVDIQKELQIINLSVKKRVSLQIAKIMSELKVFSKRNIFQLMQFGVTNEEQLENKIEKIRQYGSKSLNIQLNSRGK